MPASSASDVNIDTSIYFRDGRKKIDFVLVYEENLTAGAGARVPRRPSVMTPPPPIMLTDKKVAKLEAWRQRFMGNLRKAGLEMEEVSFKLYLEYIINIK